MRTSEQIHKRIAKVRLPKGSKFDIVFPDASTITEKEYSWNDFSEEAVVDYMGTLKMVQLSKHPIKSLTLTHGRSVTTILPENGDQIYIAFRGVATIAPDSVNRTRILGRVVGIVRQGKVIEERFLNGVDVVGVKM